MKWGICLLSWILCPLALGAAVDDKISIGILQFQHSAGIHPDAAALVDQFVSSKFTADKRFLVLERGKLGAIQAERAVQGALDVKSKTVIKDLGARYVVLGEVTQVDVVPKQSGNGSVNYDAKVSFGVKILDVSTGQVSYAQQFQTAAEFLGSMISTFSDASSTPAGGINVALRSTDKRLAAFLAEAFPVEGVVASVEKGSKKGAEEVLVTLGSEDGIAKNVKLDAYLMEIIKAGGKELVRKKSIGQLVVRKLEGEHIAIAKVESGGDEIAELLGSGHEIKVAVRP